MILENEDQALIQQYPLPDRRLISIFFNQQLVKLGRRMGVRQQALATAQVYIRRFYLKVEIRRTNPYLVVSTALYLACKMEECPQHIRLIVSEARNIWPGESILYTRRGFTDMLDFMATDISKMGECEFFLISEMNCQLIVHHPYRTLNELQPVLKLSPDEVSLAASIINDHYLTDLPMLYPLHIIASTAVFMALTLKPASQTSAANVASALQAAKDGNKESVDGNTPQSTVQFLVTWLAGGEIDVQAMIDCTQEIISLYDVWEQYNDKLCKEQIARFVKAKGLDK